jgi:hypothetical protein
MKFLNSDFDISFICRCIKLKGFNMGIVKPDHKNKKPRHVAENPWY